MKLEPCTNFNLFLEFSDSESYYSYKLYSYKKLCIYSGIILNLENLENRPFLRNVWESLE